MSGESADGSGSSGGGGGGDDDDEGEIRPVASPESRHCSEHAEWPSEAPDPHATHLFLLGGGAVGGSLARSITTRWPLMR